MRRRYSIATGGQSSGKQLEAPPWNDIDSDSSSSSSSSSNSNQNTSSGDSSESKRNRKKNNRWKSKKQNKTKKQAVIGAIHSDVESIQEWMVMHPQLTVKGQVNGVECVFTVDGGASGDFISEDFIKKHGLHSKCKKMGRSILVEVADGTKHRTDRAIVGATINGEACDLGAARNLIVLPLPGYDIILGLPWLVDNNPDINWSQRTITPRTHGSIAAITNTEECIESVSEEDSQLLDSSLEHVNTSIATLVKRFRDVFRNKLPKGLPMKRPIEYEIDLIPGSEPVYRKQYRMSLKDSEEVDKQMGEQFEAGKLRKSVSAYNAPNLVVHKEGSTKPRVVQDERGLNAQTIKMKMTLPRIDDLFDRVRGSTIFSKLDLKAGFNQIRIAEKDVHKTAFSTSTGHYEWLVMPFGLCNAPAVFQSLMQMVLEDGLNKFVVVFIDDILIYSKDEKEHLQHLQWVLEQLRKWQLYAAPDKCEWGKSEVKFLGHVVSAAGVSVMENKIKAIVEWPELKNKKEVKSFLGLAGYYRRFVQGFSKIAAPLNELTKDKQEWKWGDVEKKAFDDLKIAMSHTPILVHPRMDLPFTVTTDASGFAIGAVLSQDHGNGQQPVAFMSKKMLPAERNYPTHDKELLAIVRALSEWRCYLHGAAHPISIVTDHRSLQYLNSQPTLSGRQARWVEMLQEFDMRILYRPGKENHVADALSRRGDYEREVVHDDEQQKQKVLLSNTPHIKYSLGSISRIEDIQSSLLIAISAATKTDPSLQQILAKPDDYGYTRTEDGILRDNQGCVVVPNDRALRTLLLREVHDSPTGGHLGVEKTMYRLGKLFWWAGMRKEVQEYISTCIACQSNKASNRATAGLLHPLPIPTSKWESVSIDFVGPLTPTERGNDSIMVVVDRLTKMAHLIPCRTTITAAQVASLFFREIVRLHGVPVSIVSDRDPRFTSHFWTELWRLLGTKLNMSTAYHPQTDGQTERMNRLMEEILRSYVSDDGVDWDMHLTAAEMAINTAYQSSTEFSPFYLNHGYEMKLPMDHAVQQLHTSQSPSVEDSIRTMNADLEKAKTNIAKAQKRQAHYADQRRRLADEYKIGDRVMLSTSDFKHHAGKLSSKYVGPFKVIEVAADKTVKLDLPTSMSARHNNFNVSKVKLYRPATMQFPNRVQLDRPAPDLVDGAEEYEVEEIIGKREGKVGRNKIIEYLVKWKGYPMSECSWVKEAKLEHSQEYLDEFNAQQE